MYDKIIIIKFLCIFIFFQIIVYLINTNIHNNPLIQIYANLFKFLGYNVQQNIIFIPKLNLHLKIINECTGILMYFTLISLFFTFFDLKKAIKYSILSIPIVFFINFIRIWSSIEIGKLLGSKEIFKLAHDWLWFIITPIIIIFIFVYLIKKEKNN